MSILKIILVPLSLILSLFVWLCAGLLSCSGFVFKLASGLLSLHRQQRKSHRAD